MIDDLKRTRIVKNQINGLVKDKVAPVAMICSETASNTWLFLWESPKNV